MLCSVMLGCVNSIDGMPVFTHYPSSQPHMTICWHLHKCIDSSGDDFHTLCLTVISCASGTVHVSATYEFWGELLMQLQ